MYSTYLNHRNHIQKIFTQIFFLLIFLIANFIFSAKIFAQGDLLVIPRRVVFEGTKKTQELNLANTGKDTSTYIISFIQIRMNANGKFENITVPDSGQYFADPYIRCYPRKVTLAPNEAQTVKLQVVKSNSLLPGEYRSHLYFRAVPKEKGLLGSPELPQQDSTISVKLTPIFGITVPVILHVGNLSSQVNLSDLSLHQENNGTVLKMTFNRSGNMSVYGDLTVNHISNTGVVTPVGYVRGIAIYSPSSLRNFNVGLKRKDNIDYRSGKLSVIYKTQLPKTAEIAKAELIL